ncbi:MAG: hypothetical protein E6H76_15490 [Betaproteobacteria bacterium]|nr:MAG: hypothetical protein E6H76_15490 [Betaproteobacteria bacterium]
MGRTRSTITSMAETPSTLRVFIDGPPEPGRDAAWAVFDATGRAARSGRSPPAAWPVASRREAVIAARHGRLVTLTVPPLPPGRAEAAARFALEDQLADTPEEIHIAPAPTGSWRWCAGSIAQPGFVRTDRGATIAVGPAQGDAPPAELALALARGGAGAPRTVRVDADGASPALLSRARALTGVEFVAGTPWHWANATPAAFAGAIDILSGRYGAEASRPAVNLGRLLRPALWIAAIAIGIHVAATLGNWLWLRWESAAIDRELTALARAAVPEFAQGSAAETSPTAALARRERDLKHRAGLAAPDDFLPLLARAAPAFAALPKGAIRSLSYADGHVLLDLQKTEPAQASRLQHELQKAGLVAIAAPTATGARLRVGLN